MSAQNRIVHHGGCHCGAIRFKVKAPAEVVAMNCNCSICKMKKNTHFVVQQQDFELLQGKENLTLYQFNTMTAKHYFCKTCGVQSFYVPRSNPDGYAVTFECIDPGTLTKVTIQDVDGNNWEKVFQEEGFVAPS